MSSPENRRQIRQGLRELADGIGSALELAELDSALESMRAADAQALAKAASKLASRASAAVKRLRRQRNGLIAVQAQRRLYA